MLKILLVLEFLSSPSATFGRLSPVKRRDSSPDTRSYVGTLHQISSEDATVALENVKSYGTEGRRPGAEVPASQTVYEYIVFKGSDVKDLRIEEGPQEPEPPKPNMPDDPAILGSQRRPTPGSSAPQKTISPMPHDQHSQQGHPQPPFPLGPNARSPYQKMPYAPYGFPPQHFGGPQGFQPGPGGPGPGRGAPGFPHVPYGAPPPWYGPGGPGGPGGPAGFGPPPHMGPGGRGHFFQQPVPIGPPGQQRSPQQQPPVPPGAQLGPSAGKDEKHTGAQSGAQQENKQPSQAPPQANTPTSAPAANQLPVSAPVAPRGPAPPTATKPGVEAALAPPASVQDQLDGQGSAAPVRSNKVFPVIPLTGPTTNFGALNGNNQNAILAAQGAAAGAAQTMAAKLSAGESSSAASKRSVEDANRDARAAVAEAMAKLTGGKRPEHSAMDNLSRQVANMRTTAPSGPAQNGRRPSQSRGGRGGRGREQVRKVEVPKEAFDFEASNAKFNKQGLVKEAVASGSPIQSPVDGASPPPLGATETGAQYNKSSSFFDNISSEIKERAEAAEGEQYGGREFRNEERKKNMETFGQGSVDGGFRYGGRGRGRGRGGRGRGRGRGSYGAGQGAMTSEG